MVVTGPGPSLTRPLSSAQSTSVGPRSRDGLRRRLARYRCAGLVTVIDWPFLPEIKTPADPDDWPWPLARTLGAA